MYRGTIVLVYLGVLVNLVTSHWTVPMTNVVSPVGLGYDILHDEVRVTRPILHISRSEIDPNVVYYDSRSLGVPEEVYYHRNKICDLIGTRKYIRGPKSYQNSLFDSLILSGKTPEKLKSAAFTLRPDFKTASSDRKDFTENVCFAARVRYRLESAQRMLHYLTTDFLGDVCSLEESILNYNDLISFIKRWGTHVIIAVDYGSLIITDRRVYDSRNLLGSFSSLNDTDYMVDKCESNGKEYLKFDINKISSSPRKLAYVPNGYEVKTLEPLRYTILPLHEVINKWRWNLDCDKPINDSLINNLMKALDEYPAISGATKISVTDQIPFVLIPVTWPSGKWGLPKTSSGCPGSSSLHSNETWRDGWRRQDFTSGYTHTWEPPEIHWPHDGPSNRDVKQYFCMKEGAFIDKDDWPTGSYCIYQKGSRCPKGFQVGQVTWIEPRSEYNDNDFGGTLPDGEYQGQRSAVTRINFCCRNDGTIFEPILLPTRQPFYLFAKSAHGCQQVFGAEVKTEVFRWSPTRGPHSSQASSGSTPYGTVPGYRRSYNHALRYCYYTPKGSSPPCETAN